MVETNDICTSKKVDGIESLLIGDGMFARRGECGVFLPAGVYAGAESVCTGDNVWRFDCIGLDRLTLGVPVLAQMVDVVLREMYLLSWACCACLSRGERAMRWSGYRCLNREMGLIEGMYIFVRDVNIFNVFTAILKGKFV